MLINIKSCEFPYIRILHIKQLKRSFRTTIHYVLIITIHIPLSRLEYILFSF